MSREVRMVPPDWQHPTEWRKDYHTGRPRLCHVPLLEGPFSQRLAEWDEGAAQWDAGFERDYKTGGWEPKAPRHTYTYAEYAGKRPEAKEHMPEFPPGTATHLMMYETTSEGTPISPAFATPEELAHWLADNNASAFGDSGATYEQWLATARGGWAPSMIVDSHGLRSGVAAMADVPAQQPR